MIDESAILNKEQEEEAITLATVASVTEDGITLTVDGAGESGAKEYKCNACVLFKTGDRVKIHRDSGTIIAEYPIGTPGSRYPIPSGGTAGQALVKNSNSDYDLKWANSGGDAHGIPAGGTAGQVLVKKNATDYEVEWNTLSVSKLAYNSTVGVEINSAGVIQSINTTQPSLGSSTYGKSFKDIYTSGGVLSLGASRLGFFGTTPISRQTLSASASLSQVIQALKNYGLFI